VRSIYVKSAVLACALVATLSLAQDDSSDDDCQPKLFAVSFVTTGHAGSKELEAKLARVRTDYAGRDVLFLTADLTTPGSRHQAKLLLNSLGLGRELWGANAKSAGRLCVVSVDTGSVVKTLTGKDDLAGALDAALKADEGCDEGCGCGCEEDGG